MSAVSWISSRLHGWKLRGGARRGIDLSHGPVGGHLLSLGVFLALGVVANLGMALVDVFFVARLGARPLAALSFTFPFVLTIGALSMGLGNGVVAIVARSVGEGDHDAIRALSTDSIVLSVAIVVVLSIAGYLTVDPLFRALGADDVVRPLIAQYMHIYYLGTALQIIPQVAQNVIRAHGDTRTPSLITTMMAITNVILDPVLIFGVGPIHAFGIRGAAMANILARVLSLTGVLSVLHFRLHSLAPISFEGRRLRNSWKQLLHIGLPATATQLVIPLSAAIMTRIIAMSGDLAVASFGVATRIEQMTAIYLWAVAGALPAFVGQNAGAGRMDRVRTAVSQSIRFCVVSGVCTAVIAFTAGAWIVAHFTDDPQVRSLAAYYLRVVSLSYPLSGLVLLASQAMNALKRPLPAAMISVCRTLVILVPFALIGQWIGQVHGVFMGVSATGAACGALAWMALSIVLGQETRRHDVAVAAA